MSRFSLVLGSLLVVGTLQAAPKRLTDYAGLMNALKSGHDVSMIAEYGKMTLEIDGQQEKAPDAIGGMTLHAWEEFAAGVVGNKHPYVAFSHTTLIAHPRHGHVYNYVRARVYQDNSVEITARYLMPTDYKIVMDETFKGRISNGRDDNAISFFARG